MLGISLTDRCGDGIDKRDQAAGRHHMMHIMNYDDVIKYCDRTQKGQDEVDRNSLRATNYHI